MADIELHQKCKDCRFSCKGHLDISCRKFYPQESKLGWAIHFKEDPTRNYGKHEKTSHMCVVCKDYFHYNRIRWARYSKGYYPLCLECMKRAHFIAETVEQTEVA
jgi:hypothetical protein